MPKPVQLQRDPFARATLMRTIDSHKGEAPARECKWCGARNAERTLYAYGWESDSLRYADYVAYVGPFCSVGCYRSYGA